MYRSNIALILFWIFLVFSKSFYANVTYLHINDIKIHGASKTKPAVILNELNFKLHDTLYLADLGRIFEANEKRLLSTGLFSKADLNIHRWNDDSGDGEIIITLVESWHIFVFPVIELADRNINVWAKEFNYDLRRLNYGLNARHLSLSGRRDKLKVKFQTGYQKKGEFWYDLPGIKNGLGLSFSFFYAENKEINAYLYQNRPVFYRHENESTLLRQCKSFMDLYWQKTPNENFKLRFEYIQAVANTLVIHDINPNYFFEGDPLLNLARIQLQYTRNYLVYPLYPENGYSLNFQISGDKSIVKSQYFNAYFACEMDIYKKLFPRLIFGSRIKIKLNVTPQKIPYYLNQALGYQTNTLSGYAYYAIDGSDFGYLKNILKFNLLNTNYSVANWIPHGLRRQNVQIFFKGLLDIGFVREKYYKINNPLANQVLIGAGPGIDILFNHQYLTSIDFQINHLGEKGIYWYAGFSF